MVEEPHLENEQRGRKRKATEYLESKKGKFHKEGNNPEQQCHMPYVSHI